MDGAPLIVNIWFMCFVWLHVVGGPIAHGIHPIVGIGYSFVVAFLQFASLVSLLGGIGFGVVKLLKRLTK